VDGAGSRTPAAVAARLELAELLSAEDEVVKALDVLEPLLGGDVVAPRAALLAGELRLLRGDEKGALAAVEAAKAVDPESARVERALGKIRHAQGDEEVALQHFERALQLHKSLGEPAKGRDAEGRTPLELYYLGRALSDKNDKGDKRATQLLEDAVAREGAPPEAHYYLGKLLVKKPKTKKQGVRELQRYRALRPDGPRADEAARLAKGR
jgi:tetratricopeptide (TPR) repeat protein